MMADLISRSALYQSFRESVTECYKWAKEMAEIGDEVMYARAQQSQGTFIEACLRVKAAPAVDAEQIVRCGECKHRHEIKTNKGNVLLLCHRLPKFKDISIRVKPDGFCNYGERREDAL